MDGNESDDSWDSDDDDIVVGQERLPARRTNWRFRFDSQNQRSIELRRRLEIQFLASIQMVQHLSVVLCAILAMIREFGRQNRHSQLRQAKKLLVLLTVCLSLCDNQASYLAETMHVLSSFHYRDRPLPVDQPRKN